MISQCPCGSQQNYNDCCGRYIELGEQPQTAEQLMRSRYTAFTQKNIPYIEKTMIGPTLKQSDSLTFSTWLDDIEWIELLILNTKKGHSHHEAGMVEFRATYKKNSKIRNLTEKSYFEKLNGKWYYIYERNF